MFGQGLCKNRLGNLKHRGNILETFWSHRGNIVETYWHKGQLTICAAHIRCLREHILNIALFAAIVPMNNAFVGTILRRCPVTLASGFPTQGAANHDRDTI